MLETSTDLFEDSGVRSPDKSRATLASDSDIVEGSEPIQRKGPNQTALMTAVAPSDPELMDEEDIHKIATQPAIIPSNCNPQTFDPDAIMKSPSSSQETIIPETPVKLLSSKFSPSLLEAPTQLVCFSTPIKGQLEPERDNKPTTSAMQADHSPQASNWDIPTQSNPDLLPTMQFLIAESENSGSDTECEDSSMLPTQPNLKIHQRCFGSEETYTSPRSNAKTSVTLHCKIGNDKNLSQQATQVNPLTRNFFALANSESETEDENDPQAQDKSPELSSIKAWELLPTQPIPLNQLKNPGVTISESGSDTEFEEDTPNQLTRSPNIFELPTQINPIVKCDFVRAKTSMLVETNIVRDIEFDIYEQPTQLDPEIHRSFTLAYSGSDTEDEDKEVVRSTADSEKNSLPTKDRHSLINTSTSVTAKSSSDTEWEEDVQTQLRHSPNVYELPTQINPLIKDSIAVSCSGRKSEHEDQDDTEPVQRSLSGLKLAVLVDEPTQPNAQLSRSSSFVELEPTQPITLPCHTFNTRESDSENSSETEVLLASPLKKLTQNKLKAIFEQETQVWAIPQTKDAKADNDKETKTWTVINQEGPTVFERETQVWDKTEQRTTTADEETQPWNILKHPPLQRTIDIAHETAAVSPTKKSKSGESRLNERAKAEEPTQVWDMPTQRNPENPAGNSRMNEDSSTSDSEIEVGPSRSKKSLKRIPTPRKMRKLVIVSSDSDMELEEISSEPSIRSISRNKSPGLLFSRAARNVIRRSQMEPVVNRAATHLPSTSRNIERHVESRSPEDICNSSQLILPDTEDLTPPAHASDVTNVPVLEELVKANGKAGFASANVGESEDDTTMPLASQTEPVYGFSREASASTPGHSYWQLIQSALSCASTPEKISPPLRETTRGPSQGQSAAAHTSPQLLQASLENNNEPTQWKKRKVASVPKPRQAKVESPVISKKAKPKTHSVSGTSKTNGFFEASELPTRVMSKPSKDIVPKLHRKEIEPSKVSKSNKRKGTRKADFDPQPETSTGTQNVTTVGVLSSITIEPIEKKIARSLPAAVSRRKSSPEKKVATELVADNKEMSVRGRGKRTCTLEPKTGKTYNAQTRVEKSVENKVTATNLEPKPGTSKDEHSATKFFPKVTGGRKKTIAVEEPVQIAKVTAMRIDENEVKMTVVLAPSNISRQPKVKASESTEKDDSPVRTQSKKGKTAKLVEVKKESDELNENSNSSIQREAPRKRGRIAKTKLVEVKKEPEQMEEASKRKLRERTSVTFRVLFTGIDESDDKQLVTDLGGLVVDQVDICQILVTDKVRRTVKFLCAMAAGIPIVSLYWLRECRIRGKFVDPVPFLLKDEEGEKQHSFQLEASLAKAKKKPLLGGWQFLLTPSILPPPPEMAGILESSGAGVVSTFTRTTNEMSAVISVKDDRHLWPSYRNLRIPIIAPEAVLTGVLRQRFEVKPYELK